MRRMDPKAFRFVIRFFLMTTLTIFTADGLAQVPSRPVALDDFDFPAPGNRNDFFADRGPWTSNNGIVTTSIDSVAGWNRALRLVYDLSASGSAGGWWEHLAFSRPNSGNPFYDLSRFDTFGISIRGEGKFTTRLYVEFIQGNFEKSTRIEISGVTASWQRKSIDLKTALKGFDRTRMLQFAIVLESSHVTERKGVLHFDNLAFVDADDAAGTDDAFLDLVSRRVFDYFAACFHPATGFFQDRAWNTQVSSIASTRAPTI